MKTNMNEYDDTRLKKLENNMYLLTYSTYTMGTSQIQTYAKNIGKYLPKNSNLIVLPNSCNLEKIDKRQLRKIIWNLIKILIKRSK